MICQKCGNDYQDINNTFYAHGEDCKGNIRRDTVCKYCRREEGKQYREAKKKGEVIYKPRPFRKDLSSVRRNTRDHFLHYMTHNPVYFKEQFGREATEENIIEEYEEVRRLINLIEQQGVTYEQDTQPVCHIRI